MGSRAGLGTVEKSKNPVIAPSGNRDPVVHVATQRKAHPSNCVARECNSDHLLARSVVVTLGCVLRSCVGRELISGPFVTMREI